MTTKSIRIERKSLIACKDYKLHGKHIAWGYNGSNYECQYENGKLIKRIW